MTQTIDSQKPVSHLIFLGALRSAAGFPFEHPLELMKIKAQAMPNLTTMEVIQQIVKQKGLFGFSDTVLTNFPRRVMREAVRWPVIAYSHEHLIRRFPNSFTREGTNTKFATAVSVAIFDSVVILPLEQLIAYRAKENERYLSFFKKRFAKDGVRSLYRGFRVNLARQGAVWTTVMTFNNVVKKNFDLIDKEQAHPYLRQGVTSISIALGIIGVALPIDFVKVRIQMEPELQRKKVTSVARRLLGRYGLSRFYSGALPIFFHTLIHATLYGFVLDRLFAKDS